MIYRIPITGYMYVEADSPEEALEAARDEDFIEKCEDLGKPKKISDV